MKDLNGSIFVETPQSFISSPPQFLSPSPELAGFRMFSDHSLWDSGFSTQEYQTHDSNDNKMVQYSVLYVLAICGGANRSTVLARRALWAGRHRRQSRARRAGDSGVHDVCCCAVLVVVASAFFDSAFVSFLRCASLPREHHNQLNKSRQDKNKTICISFFPCIASSVHCFFLLK